MSEPTTARYGSWKSPITAALIAETGVQVGAAGQSGDDIYWLEGRPAEGGRYVLVRRAPDDRRADVTPPGFNVRTRVHEYGGGAYLVHEGTVFFSNFDDQRLYRQAPGEEPRPITPEPAIPAGDRYADGRVTPDGQLIVCVRERHFDGRDAENEIVVLPVDGGDEPRAIISRSDFYAFPRVNPDGKRLAWLSWDHPRMPWDGCELWVADLRPDGSLTGAERLAGGTDESIFQPEWSPDGVLHFVSDRTGWWNLYAVRSGHVQALAPMEAEFGWPMWVFGVSAYGFLPDGQIICACTEGGRDALGTITPGRAEVEPLSTPYTSIGSVRVAGHRVLIVAGSSTEATAVVRIDVDSGETEVLRRSTETRVNPGSISQPEPIEFPTERGLTAHALYYPPASNGFRGSVDEKPPLLVMSHGGPTGATSASFDLSTQFWTSRGFAVVDVNYGGSTGYGREYRERLRGQWGVVDVEDCVNAARYLVAQGKADGERLAIRGGSAGGYTTLCALTFTDVFAAGASYYGIADAETMAKDTHKFESRYLDGLIGPYPEARELYRERSAVDYTDRLSCPVILFQGLEDKVVPPSQAETMVEAMRAKGLPFAYLAFEGEQHGFRRAENIRRSLEAELYFYGRIFGFEPADEIEPVEIENL